MIKAMIPIPAGALLTISTGEYSDYSVRGVFRAIKEIDAEILRTEWLAERPEQSADYHFEENKFLGWVAQKGLIECVDAYEWHLGDYSNIDSMDVSKIDRDESVS